MEEPIWGSHQLPQSFIGFLVVTCVKSWHGKCFRLLLVNVKTVNELCPSEKEAEKESQPVSALKAFVIFLIGSFLIWKECPLHSVPHCQLLLISWHCKCQSGCGCSEGFSGVCEGQAGAGHRLHICGWESWFFIRSPELGDLDVSTLACLPRCSWWVRGTPPLLPRVLGTHWKRCRDFQPLLLCPRMTAS